MVITNNKPVGAIISLKLLDQLNRNLQLEMLEKEALAEYKKGGTINITTPEELRDFFDEIREEV